METTVLALDTRGDVQPAIALGKALAARGHAVHVLAGNSFQRWIEGHGLTAIPGSVDRVEVEANRVRFPMSTGICGVAVR